MQPLRRWGYSQTLAEPWLRTRSRIGLARTRPKTTAALTGRSAATACEGSGRSSSRPGRSTGACLRMPRSKRTWMKSAARCLSAWPRTTQASSRLISRTGLRFGVRIPRRMAGTPWRTRTCRLSWCCRRSRTSPWRQPKPRRRKHSRALPWSSSSRRSSCAARSAPTRDGGIVRQ